MPNYKLMINILTLFFISLTLFVGYKTYETNTDATHIEVDKELLQGAYSVASILDGYHTMQLSKERVSYADDLANIKKLTNYVQFTNLSYIYSFIKNSEGEYVFSSSSATIHDLDKNKSDIYSFDTYYDPHLAEAFEKKKIVFSTNTDKWGHFRSVYIPLTAPDGREYVVGSDYNHDSINYAHKDLTQEVITLYAPFFILILIFFITMRIFEKDATQKIQEKSKELHEMYEVDKKTKLSNRAKLIKDLEKSTQFKLAVIDLNGFKVINNIYGIQFADECLKFIAKELQSLTYKDEQLYKLDADLFCITNASIEDFETDIQQRIEKLESKFFINQEYEIHLYYTVGLSCDTTQSNPLLLAETALKYAKLSGERIKSYDASYMDNHSQNNERDVLDEINYAIENKKVFAYFQPIFDLKSNKITKYEALMRIEKRDSEIVAPWYFLELSHKAKVYKKLSQMMLENVINVAKEHPDLEFSMNLSSIDIEDYDIKENIIKRLTDENLTSQITLEILESEGFQDFSQLISFEKRVKNLNMKLSIDDFGSGYSNFYNLIEVNFDYIKIDGSLIKNILINKRYEVLVKQIINFAQGLNAKTIAEFVETEEIANKLKELGVDMLQGYAIDKPLQKIERSKK